MDRSGKGPLKALSRRFDDVLFFGVAALVALTPFPFGSVQPWAFKTITSTVFVILSLWFVKAAVNRGFSYIHGPFVYLAPPLLLLFTFQVVPLPAGLLTLIAPDRAAFRLAAGIGDAPEAVALYPWAAFWQWSFLLSMLVLFLLVVNYIRSARRVRRLWYAVVFSSGLVAVLAMAWKASAGSGYMLPYINRNHLAGHMEAAIPVAVGILASLSRGDRSSGFRDRAIRFFSGRRAVRAVSLVFALLAMMSALLMSMSRGGMAAMAVSLVVFALLYYRKWSNAAVALVALCLMVGVTFAVVDSRTKSKLGERVATVSSIEKEGSARLRYRIWKDSWRMVRGFPVTGVGLGCFETAYPFYKDIHLDKEVFQPESDYLYILAEAGATGLALAAFFCAAWFVTTGYSVKGRKDRFARGVVAGSMASVTSLLLHGVVDTSLHMPSILVLVTVVMALGLVSANTRFDAGADREGVDLSKTHRMVGKGAAFRPSMYAGATVCMLIAGFAAASAMGNLVYISALKDLAAVRQGGDALARDYRPALDKLSLAYTLDPLSADYSIEEGKAHAVMADRATAVETGGGDPEAVGDPYVLYNDALASFREGLRRDRYSSLAHFLAGRAFEKGLYDRKQAEAEYAMAERLNPKAAYILSYLADYHERQGEVSSAKGYKDRLKGLDQRYNPVKDLSLSAEIGQSGVRRGTKVTWKVGTDEPPGAVLFSYEVRRADKSVVSATGFTTSTTFVWDTSALAPGRYIISAHAMRPDDLWDSGKRAYGRPVTVE